MRFRKLLVVAAFAGSLLPAASVAAQTLADVARESKQKGQSSSRRVLTNDDLHTGIPEIKLLRQSAETPSLAPFEPTSPAVIAAMLTLAGVQRDDLVFDVGSGDGRIVIQAAESFGARGVGIEIDETLVAESRRRVKEKGLEERVRIIQANAMDVDLSQADVVTLFLTTHGLETLRPHLERTLRPGTRVVAHTFEIPGWTPIALAQEERRQIFLYRVR